MNLIWEHVILGGPLKLIYRHVIWDGSLKKQIILLLFKVDEFQ